MAIEVAMGIVFATLLGGVAVGYLLGKGKDSSARVRELESQLEAAQAELTDYKSEVFGQFAETAEKFRALDKSYNELHRQLAQSSVALCGDDATPLLAGPDQSLLAETAAEKELNPVPDADEIGIDAEAAIEAELSQRSAETAEEATDPAEQESIVIAESPAADAEPAQDEAAKSSSVAATDVPILTEVETPDRDDKRQSA